MSWHPGSTLPWQSPLELAATYRAEDMALLYSGLQEKFSGHYSYLFLEPTDAVLGSHWDDLPPTSSKQTFPEWVGYLSYELGEHVPDAPPSVVTMPRFRLVRYAHMLRFDHHARTVQHFSWGAQRPLPAALLTGSLPSQPPAVTSLSSNFSRRSYEACIARTLDEIHAGNFYQANITRKFWGTFASVPDYFSLFSMLSQRSPAPYGAFIRHGATAILSSSPECLLSLNDTGQITTRPIKGSARRSDNPQEDAAICAALQSSDKNHAENLMIVDLMRNDLSHISAPGSVRVSEQSALYSYATIHHLISTVQAHKEPRYSAYDVARACFPPGSMTGAPKIAAMQWCARQETLQRGVYSGAIGWFGGAENCDLSVVIRTLLLKEGQFEFQVGGGIVADSTPEDEWRETLTKARAIASTLGIQEAALEAL